MDNETYEREVQTRDSELERAEEVAAWREQLDTEVSWESYYESKLRSTRLNILDLQTKITNLGGKI